MPLILNDRPDGFGWLYGSLTDAAGRFVARVDIMPPVAEWRGDTVCPGYEPDPVAWKVFADGEEVARAERREALGAALLALPSKEA